MRQLSLWTRTGPSTRAKCLPGSSHSGCKSLPWSERVDAGALHSSNSIGTSTGSSHSSHRDEGSRLRAHVLSTAAPAIRDHLPVTAGSSSSPSVDVPGAVADPPLITRYITNCKTTAELQLVIARYRHRLNPINVAAAIVKLVKLVCQPIKHTSSGVRQAEDDAGDQNRATSHSSASTSTSSVASTHDGSRGRHRVNGHSRASASGQQQLPVKLPSSQTNHDDPAASSGSSQPVNASMHGRATSNAHGDVSVKQLVDELGNMFMHNLPHYEGARQFANVTWALGKLRYSPSQQLISDIMQQLVSNDSAKLKAGVAQELANLAYGLARLGHTAPSSWAAVAAASAPRLQEFKSQELANMAWSLASVAREHQLVGLIAQQAVQQLADFKVQELVNLLWACGKSRCHHKPLFAAAADWLCQACSMGMLNGQDIGNAAWAFAKVRHRHEPLFEALSEQLLSNTVAPAKQNHQQQQQQHSHAARSVGVSSTAGHTMGHITGGSLASIPQPFLQPSATATSAPLSGNVGPRTASTSTSSSSSSQRCLLSSCSNQELCNVLWSSATLNYRNSDLVQGITEELSARAHSLPPQSISNAVWAVAKLQLSDAAFAARMVQAAAPKVQYFNSQEVSNLLWAAVTLGLTNSAALQPLIEAVRWKADDMQPAALSQVVWVSTQLAGEDGEVLLHVVCCQALQKLQHFKPQDLAILAHSLAKKGHADPILFSAIAEASIPHLSTGSFTPLGLANLAWAFASAHQHQPDLTAALTKMAGARLEALGLRELSNLLWGLTRLRVRNRELLDRAGRVVQQGNLRGAGQAGPPQPSSPLPGAALIAESAATATQSSSSEASSSSSQGSHESLRAPAIAHGDQDSSLHAGPARMAGPKSESPGMCWATLAWSFARSGYHQSQLYDTIATAVTPHLHTLQSNSLRQLLWAFAVTDHHHPALFNACASLVAQRLGEMPPKAVASIAWCYSKLQHSSPLLLNAMLRHAMSQAHTFDLKSWSCLASAFSTLCHPGEELFFPRLQQLQLQEQQQRRRQQQHRQTNGKAGSREGMGTRGADSLLEDSEEAVSGVMDNGISDYMDLSDWELDEEAGPPGQQQQQPQQQQGQGHRGRRRSRRERHLEVPLKPALPVPELFREDEDDECDDLSIARLPKWRPPSCGPLYDNSYSHVSGAAASYSSLDCLPGSSSSSGSLGGAGDELAEHHTHSSRDSSDVASQGVVLTVCSEAQPRTTDLQTAM